MPKWTVNILRWYLPQQNVVCSSETPKKTEPYQAISLVCEPSGPESRGRCANPLCLLELTRAPERSQNLCPYYSPFWRKKKSCGKSLWNDCFRFCALQILDNLTAKCNIILDSVDEFLHFFSFHWWPSGFNPWLGIMVQENGPTFTGVARGRTSGFNQLTYPGPWN